jgi:hypothetical protein
MIEDHALITCSIDTGNVTELEIHTVFGVSEDVKSPQMQTSAEADGAPAAFAKLVADSASLVSRLDRREQPSESAVPTHTGGLERHSRDEDEESIGICLRAVHARRMMHARIGRSATDSVGDRGFSRQRRGSGRLAEAYHGQTAS